MHNNRCLVVMYHYVRDLQNSRYPGIKGLTIAKFREQLDYLQKSHVPVTAQDIHDCIYNGATLPENACLLTFDDGYLEHYTEVFPELCRRGLSGCFYPPIAAIERRRLLNVNKIHLLLAHLGESGFGRLLAATKDRYCKMRTSMPTLPEYHLLWKQLAVQGRFDTPEVIFFKRFLQHAIPEALATRILDELWDEFMDVSQKVACSEMYVSKDMLRVMAANGMHIGSHGTSHRWLDKIDEKEQEEEILASLDFLRDIHGTGDFLWSIAYPFGGVNESLKGICSRHGASFGLTTVPAMGRIDQGTALMVPRMDTNDILCN